MKKTLLLMVVLALIVSCVVGCATPAPVAEAAPAAEPSEAEAPAEEAAPAEDGVKSVTIGDYTFEVDTTKDPSELEIAVVYMNVTAPYCQVIKAGVDDFAAEYGVNAYLTGRDDWDTNQEIEVIENLISKGVDGIALAVMDEPGMTGVIQEAMEAGIPVVCLDADAPSSGRLGYIGEDPTEAGAMNAQGVADALGGKGKVLLSTVAQSAEWSRMRQDGVESVLKNYPDIEVVQIVDCPGSEDEQYTALENAFLAHQDIDAAISMGGTAYVFARVLKDYEMGNLDSDHPIYNSGHDLSPAEEVLKQIEDGWLYTMYTAGPYQMGYGSAEMLYNFLTTGDASAFSVVSTQQTCVTRENYQPYVDDMKAGLPVG